MTTKSHSNDELIEANTRRLRAYIEDISYVVDTLKELGTNVSIDLGQKIDWHTTFIRHISADDFKTMKIKVSKTQEF